MTPPITIRQSEDAEIDDGELGPAIIAETQMAIRELTVGDAVMQMDLSHAPVMVFRNEKGGAINVVYRREDGNIGWIDPQQAQPPGVAAEG